jgi:hypothetical protein
MTKKEFGEFCGHLFGQYLCGVAFMAGATTVMALVGWYL